MTAITLDMKTKVIVPEGKQLYFVCIGTDRSTGDSFGPLVGMMLKQHGIPNVIGCLDKPCHAMNLEEMLTTIPEDAFVVGIDACLGQVSNVGRINVGAGPVRPGAGVNKTLPHVGDAHITGIVNVGGFMEYFVLQNTRLSLVMEMAKQASDVCIDISRIAYVDNVHNMVYRKGC